MSKQTPRSPAPKGHLCNVRQPALVTSRSSNALLCLETGAPPILESLKQSRGHFLEVVGGSVEGSASASTTLPSDGSLREAQSNAKAGAASTPSGGAFSALILYGEPSLMGALWIVKVAEVAASTKFPRPLQIMFLSLPLSRNPLFVGSGTEQVVLRGSCGAAPPANDSIETTEVFPRSQRITAGRLQCAKTPERLSASSKHVSEKV